MIQASELRIGNWLEWRNPNTEYTDIAQVDAADFVLITNKNVAHHYFPIPLTPEILEKVDWNGYIKFHINSNFCIDDMCHLYYHNDYTGINIYHVHQFQNLYFALTGKELEINLP